jgi:hypothetical protein
MHASANNSSAATIEGRSQRFQTAIAENPFDRRARLSRAVFAAVACFLNILDSGCGPGAPSERKPAPPAVAPTPYQSTRDRSGVPPTGGEANAKSLRPEAAGAQSAVTHELGETSSVELDLAKTSYADLNVHDWDTEAAHDVISRQLDELGKRITHSDDLTLSWLTTFVTDDFQCTPLRPSPSQEVFRDAALTVSRSATMNPSDPFKLQGAKGLSKAVQHLLTGVLPSSAAETKFKVFRIEVEGSRISTSLYYHLRAPRRGGTIQQTATWHCVWQFYDREEPPRLRSIRVLDFEEAVGRGNDGDLFVDCTESVLAANESYQQQLVYGLDYWLGRVESRFGIEISGWNGLAVGDVNGDRLDDIYLCQPGGLPNRLFLQNEDGTATDHSARAGVDWRDESSSALLVDLDNDGDQDLALATALGLIVMANDGQATFRVVAAKSLPEAAPLSLAAADFDNDGYVDIYVTCYSIRGGSQERRFLGRPVPYHDANNGGRNVLFRNLGGTAFTDVTRAVGLDQNNRRFSMAAAWEDYDNDGDQDLYVANDYGRNNLYRNDEGHFEDVAADAGVEDISAGMSVSWGDVNGDGWMDLYVSNMFSSAGNRIAYQRRFHASAEEHVRAAYQRHARGNSLFLNSGGHMFEDVSVSADVTMGRWAWGSRFVDINNDSWQDIVVANGFITQADSGDL